jgi:hypothetical protein
LSVPCSAIVAATSTSLATIRSAANRPGCDCFTPAAVTRAILTEAGGCAAVSTATSATVTVRVHVSKETLPWLAFAPVARIDAKAASTSLAARLCT